MLYCSLKLAAYNVTTYVFEDVCRNVFKIERILRVPKKKEGGSGGKAKKKVRNAVFVSSRLFC
jgi:hypothetical protein